MHKALQCLCSSVYRWVCIHINRKAQQRFIPNHYKRYTCRIKTGRSNLVSCFGPRMRVLATVFHRGESRGKYRASARIRLFVSLKLIFIVPFNFYSISMFFLISGGGCHWQGTASGPKSHIGRSKKWHWQGRKVTQGPKCHLGVL